MKGYVVVLPVFEKQVERKTEVCWLLLGSIKATTTAVFNGAGLPSYCVNGKDFSGPSTTPFHLVIVHFFSRREGQCMRVEMIARYNGGTGSSGLQVSVTK